MDGKYSIAEASDEDLVEVKDIRLKLEGHLANRNKYLWSMTKEKESKLEESYKRMIEGKTGRIVLVREHQTNEIVGLGIGTIIRDDELTPNRFGKIDDVWVEEQHRNKGICREVVRRLLEFFKEKEITDLTLDYVVGNWEAEAVWKKMGFHPVLAVANAKMHEVEEYMHK